MSCPYCEGSPEGKYGLVWEMGCLRDLYVFDEREYAVDFIVIRHGGAGGGERSRDYSGCEKLLIFRIRSIQYTGS